MNIRTAAYHLLLLAVAIGTAAGAAAQTVVTTINEPTFAEEGLGVQHRDSVNQGFELAHAGQPGRAMDAVQPALAYCEAQLAREDVRFVSVVDAAQYHLYLDEHADGAPTEWLDVACASAYTLVGFLHAGEKRMEAALPFLDRAIAIAPYYPNPLTEKGFVLNQLGRHDEAISAYRAAIALGERHASAAHMKAIALRGIGWALVEQGDLDGAQRAYEDSLVVDPGNRTALGELEYIAQQRADAASSDGE